jgi:hypothetical protein
MDGMEFGPSAANSSCSSSNPTRPPLLEKTLLVIENDDPEIMLRLNKEE